MAAFARYKTLSGSASNARSPTSRWWGFSRVAMSISTAAAAAAEFLEPSAPPTSTSDRRVKRTLRRTGVNTDIMDALSHFNLELRMWFSRLAISRGPGEREGDIDYNEIRTHSKIPRDRKGSELHSRQRLLE